MNGSQSELCVVTGQAKKVEQQYGGEGRDKCGGRRSGRGPRWSDGSAIRRRSHETMHPEWTVSHPGGERWNTKT